MNETMSLLLVATVLAIGGAGLYIYKFEDDLVQDGGNESADSYNEDELDEEIITMAKKAGLFGENSDLLKDIEKIPDSTFVAEYKYIVSIM